MAAAEEILGTNVFTQFGERIDISKDFKGKIIGLYFSAHWCPPCQKFTTILANFYYKLKIEKNFEIVFISGDEDAGEFKDYFETMPWLAVSFDDREKIVIIFNDLI